MEEIKILKSYLGSLNVGRPITQENLTLFPVTEGHSRALSYPLLEEAMQTEGPTGNLAHHITKMLFQ